MLMTKKRIRPRSRIAGGDPASALRRGVMKCLAAAALGVGGTTSAHHTYAVFDMVRPASVVEGRFAKLEWRNPHVFIWLWVANPAESDRYDAWGFESDPVNVMQRYGWSKDVLVPGEPVTLQYFPLRDGRPGGYFVRLVRADGSELIGSPDAPGVARELAKTDSLPKRQSVP
jgi:hypothetical protein